MIGEPLLVVDALSIAPLAGAPVLVDAVSFSIARGSVLGIVGESGSGKSTMAMAIAGLLSPALRVTGGSIRLDGVDLLHLAPLARRALNGDAIGLVFQDPLSSFNPLRRIGSGLIEVAMRHRGLSRTAARALALEKLADMRLADPERIIDAYPHQLSGGQRQRVMIALALINDPPLLIADEPTTALDATVQRSILAMLRRQAAGRASILITHDLGVAISLCDDILVMKDGRAVEYCKASVIATAHQHPYTGALIAAAASFRIGSEVA